MPVVGVSAISWGYWGPASGRPCPVSPHPGPGSFMVVDTCCAPRCPKDTGFTCFSTGKHLHGAFLGH